MLKTAASSSFSVDWGAFGLVVVAALVAAVLIVTFFAIALRLLSAGQVQENSGASVAPRSTAATSAAYLCIAICGAVVIYGLYLVIPLFHQK